MSDTTHDARMLDALRGVRFGHFNQRQRFVQQVQAEGVKSERQRWWLTKLVHMHREQVMDKSAVVAAARWLEQHPDRTALERMSEPQEAAPAPPATTALPDQPTLF